MDGAPFGMVACPDTSFLWLPLLANWCGLWSNKIILASAEILGGILAEIFGQLLGAPNCNSSFSLSSFEWGSVHRKLAVTSQKGLLCGATAYASVPR